MQKTLQCEKKWKENWEKEAYLKGLNEVLKYIFLITFTMKCLSVWQMKLKIKEELVQWPSMP